MTAGGRLRAADAPAASPDAAALLAKHVAFMGWKFGDGSVNSLKLEETYTDKTGAVTSTETELQTGLAYRTDYSDLKRPTYNSSSGFTGNIFWRTNENGFTTPVIGDPAKYYLAVDALFADGAPLMPATMHGTGTANGKTVPIVRATMSGAVPIDLYIDPDTGEYLRAVIDPSGSYETTVNFKSYIDLAPGKKYFGSWSINESKGTHRYTKAELNPKIADSELHPPASSATWTFANDQAFPIKVTDSRIYVDAKVNGVPGRFIFDTGSYGIALTDEFANRANVKDIDRGRAEGIGGETKSRIRKADTVEIGGNTLSNVVVSTLNMEFTEDRYNTKVDGLIGFDLLGGAIVTVSTANQTMRIENPASATVNKNAGIDVLADLTRGTPVVPMQVNHKIPVEATLDTGNTSFVIVSTDLRGQGINMLVDNSAVGYLSSHVWIGGVGGDEEVECGRVSEIALGPIVYQNPATCMSHNFSGHEALIGFDFLKHFDYIFDYPEALIIMTPHKDE